MNNNKINEGWNLKSCTYDDPRIFTKQNTVNCRFSMVNNKVFFIRKKYFKNRNVIHL